MKLFLGNTTCLLKFHLIVRIKEYLEWLSFFDNFLQQSRSKQNVFNNGFRYEPGMMRRIETSERIRPKGIDLRRLIPARKSNANLFLVNSPLID